jgi:hypothetical protein
MTEEQVSDITEKDRQAVKRLREYFRRRQWDLRKAYRENTDKYFLQWLGDVMQSIHSAEYARVKQVLENDPAFTKRKGKK